MPEETLTHEQALELIDQRTGEDVYVGFFYAQTTANPYGFVPVQHVQGKLENDLDPRPPRLDPGHGYYAIGSFSFGLPPLKGVIHRWGNAIEFRVAEEAVIWIAWRGSLKSENWGPVNDALDRLALNPPTRGRRS